MSENLQLVDGALTYYKIEDWRDTCHRPPVFDLCYRSEDAAVAAALQHLRGLAVGQWFRPPTGDTNLRMAHGEKVHYRPAEDSISVSVDADGVPSISCATQYMVTTSREERSTTTVDGQEYSRTETLTDEVHPWSPLMETKHHWMGSEEVPVTHQYNLYIGAYTLNYAPVDPPSDTAAP